MNIKFTFNRKAASSSDQKMQVILGSHTVKAFVAAPKDVRVIGIVRLGMEYGLLAVTPTGNYVRVNGSDTKRLNNRDVEEAIYKAKNFGRGESFASSRSADLAPEPAPTRAPSVLLKRHRKIDPELAANNSQLQPLAA